MSVSRFARQVLWAAASALPVLLCLAAGSAAEGSIADCIDATCRVSAEGRPLGTGCVFQRSGGRVLVLTNAHVVEGFEAVDCQFWQQGHESLPLAGTVAWRVRNAECDAAVVVLAESQFGSRPPAVIPLASADYVIRPGETVLSVGCVQGAWATAWKGHARGYVGTDQRFLPVPAGGRSGSAIFDADGSRIVGLLFARTADDSEGMAVSLQALDKHLKLAAGVRPPLAAPHDACRAVTLQCPGGQCPIPRPNRQIQLFGRQEYQSTPYPTLPPVQPEDHAPLVPVNPADAEARARLDVLERDLADLREALDGTTRKADAAAGAVTTETTAAKEEVGKLRERLTGLAGLVEKAKSEGAEGIHEVARKVVWGIIQSYGWPVGGAVGLAFFLLWRRIEAKREAGEPLLYERALGRIRERVGGLDDDALVSRIADRVRERFGRESVDRSSGG